MTRVAIPITNNKLSNRFVDCTHYEVFGIENKNVVDQYKLTQKFNNIDDICNWVKNESITDIIVHYIDKQYVNLFSGRKVNLYVGIDILNPNDLIAAYMNGTLRSNTRNYLTDMAS